MSADRATQSGLVSLAEQLNCLPSIKFAPPPPPKPSYEEVEEAFHRWENLLWNGASSEKVRRAEQTYNKLVSAFLGTSTV